MGYKSERKEGICDTPISCADVYNRIPQLAGFPDIHFNCCIEANKKPGIYSSPRHIAKPAVIDRTVISR
jgi:hypothetical protein